MHRYRARLFTRKVCQPHSCFAHLFQVIVAELLTVLSAVIAKEGVCVCVCMPVYVYVFVCTCIYASTCLCVHVFVCALRICVCVLGWQGE